MDWNDYWRKNNENSIYSFIAKIYRKVIFKRMLRSYFTKYFTKDGLVLHAGCGSGQVDEELAKEYKIVALDVSSEALSLYKKNVANPFFRIKGSVVDLPFLDNSFEGVYNLGVFEHFQREEIEKALSEIRRVLKRKGKAVIFWPPEFGITVIFLKAIHFIVRSLGCENFKLHPDEISRLKSKKEAIKIFEQAGFRVKAVCFNWIDLFTMIAVVATKED
ncbi:MAG: hypothetical protein OHK0040_12750 [bacterium]